MKKLILLLSIAISISSYVNKDIDVDKALTTEAYRKVQGQKSGQSKVIADTIPFRLTDHNNISIIAILNDADTLDLMFHTAANGVTLIQEVAENLKTIKLITMYQNINHI